MKNITVSFGKKFSEDGTVYRKNIHVPSDMMHDINYHLAQEAMKAEKAGDVMRKTYLISHFRGEGNVLFTNLTQQEAILDYLFGLDYCTINKKRASTVANMAIVMI